MSGEPATGPAGPTGPRTGGDDHRAWRDFCRALEEAGERILQDDFPTSDADRAEGFRHLAEQAACWLTWGIGHTDARRPAFMRQNDLVLRWGGPNMDNVYRHCRIDPAGVYRITGHMHACEEFLLALRIGNMHEETYGTLHELTATDLGIRPGEPFEILLGGDAPGAIAIPDGTRMVAIREYYYDWRPQEPATFTIERVDDVGEPPRWTPGDVAAQLDEARGQFARSVTHWNQYLRDQRARGVDNVFIPPRHEARGVKALQYAFCFLRIAPDEALIVETEAPSARYWSFQLYTPGWFEPFESVGRTGGLNHRQVLPDPDGRIRVVAAHRDPGLHNWLDLEGRPEGLLTFRCGWTDRRPAPVATVVPLAEVARHLPEGAPRADEAGRRAQIDARRAHARWRFRA